MSRQKLHRRFIIDGTTETGTVPDNYLDAYHDDCEIVTFQRLMDILIEEYNIDAMPVAFDESSSDVVGSEDLKTDTEFPDCVDTKFQVTFNPAWMPDGAHDRPASKDNPIWDIVTKTYTPVGSHEMWIPLLSVLQDRDLDVFGELRLTRSGGNMHMDLFIPEYTVDYDDFEHTLGISTGHDYYGNTRLYAEVIALDLHDDLRKSGHNVLRDLTDAKKRKHTGEADEEVDHWWEVVIEMADEVSDTLYGVVADAMNYEIDISDLRMSLPEFYEYLGLPNSGDSEVADKAAKRAVSTVAGGYDAYHLHRAAMHALEDTYAGKDTRAFVQHTATVNELLFNPPSAERTVMKALYDDIDDKQTRLETFEDADLDVSPAELETERDRISGRIESIPEGKAEFESQRERLRTMLDDAESATDEGGAA